MNTGLLVLLGLILVVGLVLALALCRFSSRLRYREFDAGTDFLDPTVPPGLPIRSAMGSPIGIGKSSLFPPKQFDPETGAYLPRQDEDPDHYSRMEAMTFPPRPQPFDQRKRLVLFRNPALDTVQGARGWNPPH